MKKVIGTLLIAAIVFFGGTHNLMAACGSLESTSLRLILNCVEYAGQPYEVAFAYYSNPADPSNLYWRFSSLRAGTAGGHCGSVDTNLNIREVCVNYLGVQYTFNLDRYNNPTDPGGLYWKLQTASLAQLPGSIQGVSGENSVCYPADYNQMDPSQLQAMEAMVQCMTDCSQQPQDQQLPCILNCFGALGLPSSFPLGLTLNNPTSTTIEYSIPAGFVFSPDSGDLQPMLVLQDCIFTVDPGQSSTFCVPTYCLDVDRHAPDGAGDTYAPGEVASQQCLQDIIAAAKGKNISGTAVMQIQQIIWNCMENGSISAQDRAFLEGL